MQRIRFQASGLGCRRAKIQLLWSSLLSLSVVTILDFVPNVNSVPMAFFVEFTRAVIYNKGSWERHKFLSSL